MAELIERLEEFGRRLREHRALWADSLGILGAGPPERNLDALREQSRALGRLVGQLRPYLARFGSGWTIYVPLTGARVDALQAAIGLQGASQIKGSALNGVESALEEVIGRLLVLPSDADVPLDPGDPIRESEPCALLAAPAAGVVKIFVSHSSADQGFAVEMVQLLQLALNLPADAIRCTSVDGYRLPGGVDTDARLRAEILAAPVFIALVSQNSVASVYVLFELGARWGAERPLIPVLAPGVAASALAGPIARLNALSAGSAGQLHQLVTDVASQLGCPPAPPASYQAQIERIVSLPQVRAAAAAADQERSDEACLIAFRQLRAKNPAPLALPYEPGSEEDQWADRMTRKGLLTRTALGYVLPEDATE